MQATVGTLQPVIWNAGMQSNRPNSTGTLPSASVSHFEAKRATDHVHNKSDYASWSDESLMAAIALRDSHAVETLYDRYVNGCYGLALKIVRDPSVAEEVVQDVFLKLWSRPESFVPTRGKFSGWLLTMVHNRSVDRLRRARTGAMGNSVPFDLDLGPGIALADTLPDDSPTPHDVAWREAKGKMLRRALELLPQTQREAISLAYFGGLTQKEIAERLGEPLGTIKTRTRTGLLQLRRLLALQGLTGDAA